MAHPNWMPDRMPPAMAPSRPISLSMSLNLRRTIHRIRPAGLKRPNRLISACRNPSALSAAEKRVARLTLPIKVHASTSVPPDSAAIAAPSKEVSALATSPRIGRAAVARFQFLRFPSAPSAPPASSQSSGPSSPTSSANSSVCSADFFTFANCQIRND